MPSRPVHKMVRVPRALLGCHRRRAVQSAHREHQQRPRRHHHLLLDLVQLGVLLPRFKRRPERQTLGLRLRHHSRRAEALRHIGVVQYQVDLLVVPIISRHDQRVPLIVKVQTLLVVSHTRVFRPNRRLGQANVLLHQIPLNCRQNRRMGRDVVQITCPRASRRRERKLTLQRIGVVEEPAVATRRRVQLLLGGVVLMKRSQRANEFVFPKEVFDNGETVLPKLCQVGVGDSHGWGASVTDRRGLGTMRTCFAHSWFGAWCWSGAA